MTFCLRARRPTKADFMSRGRCTFRQSDATKAIKAAVAAGVEVARVEIDKDGRRAVHQTLSHSLEPDPGALLRPAFSATPAERFLGSFATLKEAADAVSAAAAVLE